MQGIGAALLIASPRVSLPTLRVFFGAQAALFPFGLLLCWMPLVIALMLIGNPLDREFFTDAPIIFLVSQPIWVLTSLFICFALRAGGWARIRRDIAKVLHRTCQRLAGSQG